MREDCILCLEDIHHKQDFFHWLKQDALLCGECRNQLAYVNTFRKLGNMKIHILYSYNDFIENMLFQFKEGRDIALAPVFLHDHKRRIEQMYKGYTMIFMPSSEEKTKERGFYALEEMYKEIKLAKLAPFYKSENRKQSTLHYEERQKIAEVIHLLPKMHLPKKKLLLVDDVCTTGATLKCAYDLLHEHTVEIEAFVLCANPLFLQQDRKNSLMKKLIRKGR